MRMRTFIHVKPPNMSVKTAHHARYISERERDPEREEPQSRPIFTHDRDGLKHTAADRYLAGGTQARAKTRDLQHVIIAFNSHDAKELEKLAAARVQDLKNASSKSEETEPGQHSSKNEEAKLLQIERDKPFAEAVRRMMENLEEQTDLSDLRYALTVHRHTTKTHVHLLLRREYTSKDTGERSQLPRRLPEEFLNGRDELGKAKAGILDISLSAALDTMIPQRQRPARKDEPTQPASPQFDETRNLHLLNSGLEPPEAREQARRLPPSPESGDRKERRLKFSPRRDPTRPTEDQRPHPPTATTASPQRTPALQTVSPEHVRAGTAPDETHARQIEAARAAAERSHSLTRPSNLQDLNPNLQPILQDLKIAGDQPRAQGDEKSAAKNKISGLKKDPASPTISKPAHVAPETLINSQLTDRAATPHPPAEKHRGTASRGR